MMWLPWHHGHGAHSQVTVLMGFTYSGREKQYTVKQNLESRIYYEEGFALGKLSGGLASGNIYAMVIYFICND